ncbi:MAG: type II 3-dehydroquinate dehydratase [Fidelibacterota bacterium]
MDILILQGPNLNLIGVQSAKTGERVTLDKINKVLHQHAHKTSLDIQLRFLQTHKTEKAISFIHRNRNKAAGLLIAPASWGRYEYSLLDALNLSGLPSVQVLLDDPYSSLKKVNSIFTPVCIDTVIGHPLSAFNTALNVLLKHIS